MSRDLACDYLVDLLGVTRTEALMEMNQNRGLHVRFSWLLDVYNDRSQEERLDCAARAFLMYLIGCTLFPDKRATYIDVVYLDLFRDLTQCSTYAWGVAMLTYLYEHLGDASIHSCKQLGGYLTLLQALIFEDFPSLGSCRLNSGYTEDQPRPSHWILVRGAGTVIPCQVSLDQLTIDDVRWMPYADHREHRPFQDISLYSGYIRCGGLMRPHLPERVLRQYGHVQGIPRSPRTITDEPMSTAEIDDWWQHYGDHLVDDATEVLVSHILDNVLMHTCISFIGFLTRTSHHLLRETLLGCQLYSLLGYRSLAPVPLFLLRRGWREFPSYCSQ